MPCFRPITAFRFPDCYRDENLTRFKKFKIWLNGKAAQEKLQAYTFAGYSHEILQLPCGKCIGCQMKRAADWALRCVHELQSPCKACAVAFGEDNWRYCQHRDGCFLTLTYDHKHLPAGGTLVREHWQDFMKALRHHVVRKENRPHRTLRFFMCGEYGAERLRPHYHAVIFGWSPSDKVEVPNNPGTTDPLYDSQIVADLWKQGRVRVGSLTYRSCHYVARYCLKKAYGEAEEKVYTDTGRVPPFNGMSQGIGREFFFRFKSDIFPSDFLVDEEAYRKHAVPRFYDKLAEAIDSQAFEVVKRRRQERGAAFRRAADFTPERLRDREQAVRLRLGRLRRGD